MTYKVELLPRARKELVDAWDWYDDRWAGLGDRFKERKNGFRETAIKVFPYLYYIQVTETE